MAGHETSGPTIVILRDIDGDGRLDIVLEQVGGESATILLQPADGALAWERTARAIVTRSILTVADVNGDGNPDFVRAVDREISVQLNAR